MAIPRRNPAKGTVAALFRIADRDELPSAVLVELLGELGTRPSAARRLLARMRDSGQLAGRREGRSVHLRLAGPFAAAVRREGERFVSEPPPWTGEFHALLFAAPERKRAYRDRLRRAAVLGGYGVLQPGVLISPSDGADDLADVLNDAPPDARVIRARLAMDIGEAARAARSAWDLDSVARVLAGHADRLADAVTHEPAEDADTLRRLVELTNPVYVDLVRVPALPSELLPPHWPLPRLGRELWHLVRHHLPAARAYVARRSDPAFTDAPTRKPDPQDRRRGRRNDPDRKDP